MCNLCNIQPAKFFQLELQKHACEQCTLNEIYAQEVATDKSDILKKLMFKMQNIIRIR
jgi:hypothetical protein